MKVKTVLNDSERRGNILELKAIVKGILAGGITNADIAVMMAEFLIMFHDEDRRIECREVIKSKELACKLSVSEKELVEVKRIRNFIPN